jgi:small subunit ribosomal protein S1
MNDSLTAGQIIEVTVTRLEHYGAFCDFEGRTGLITLPEISWSITRHPGDRLTVGERLKVKVIMAPPGREFSASIRQVHPERDPWIDPSRFRVGSIHEGKVTQVLDYGYFIELYPDVRGLLKKENWPRPMQVGEQAKVQVISMDARLRKIEVVLCPADALP